MLPNAAAPILVTAVLGVPEAILAEAGLSFLGFGVQPPQATWGSMISDGKNALDESLNLALVSAATMFFTILSLNLVGDGFRRRYQLKDAQI